MAETKDLIARMRAVAAAVYLATEEPVARHISETLLEAVTEIEHLRAKAHG